MSLTPIQLEDLIQDALTDTLNEQQQNTLRQELSSSQEARDLYCFHQRMDCLMKQRSQGLKALAQPPSASSMDLIYASQKQRSLRIALSSVAAIILVTLIALSLIVIKSDAPPLVFKISPGTQFSLSHSEPSDSTSRDLTMKKGSRLQLTQGTVELTFETGVRSIVMAPADLTLRDDNQLYLHQGIAWFHVPPEAVGFQVTSEDLDIVDLGTEFGVIAHPSKLDEVHVFKGKVQVTSQRFNQESTHLAADESRRIDLIGKLDTIASSPSSFPTDLPETLPHLHWSFDDGDTRGESNFSLRDELETQLHSSSPPSLSRNFTAGKFGTAVSLDGISDHLTTNYPGILGNSPRSVAFWLKMPPRRMPATRAIVSWGKNHHAIDLYAPLNHKFAILFDYSVDSNPQFNISFGGFWYFSRDTNLDDNNWHHVAVIYDGRPNDLGDPSTHLYIDGISHKLENDAHFPIETDQDGRVKIETQSHSPLTIGANISRDPQKTVNSDECFNGQIDELYIIKGAISKNSVIQLMKTNKLNPEPKEE